MTPQEENREILFLSGALAIVILLVVASLAFRFMELTNIKDIVGIIKDLTTVIAIILGGIWTYFNFIKGRVYNPRLEPGISGKILEKDDLKFIVATATLKNIGLTKVDISSIGLAIIVHTYQPARVTEISTADKKRLTSFPVFKEHAWLEPAETIKDEQLFEIPEYEGIAIRLELRFVYNGIEWNSGAVVQTTPESDVISTKQKGRTKQ